MKKLKWRFLAMAGMSVTVAAFLAVLPVVMAYSSYFYYIGNIAVYCDSGSRYGYEGGWYHWDSDGKAEVKTEFSIPGGWSIQRGATLREGESYTWVKSCNGGPVPMGTHIETHTDWDTSPIPASTYVHFAEVPSGNRVINWKVWESDLYGASSDQKRKGTFDLTVAPLQCWVTFGNSIQDPACDSSIQVYYIGAY